MTHTNETIAKCIAPYIGCEFIDTHEKDPEHWLLTGVCRSECEDNEWIACSTGSEYYINEIKLILRPLSGVLYNEKMEIWKIITSMRDVFTYWEPVDEVSDYLKYSFCDSIISDKKIAWNIYQYLQSIGIDLPCYLLGGKTLREAGLALYETDLK